MSCYLFLVGDRMGRMRGDSLAELHQMAEWLDLDKRWFRECPFPEYYIPYQKAVYAITDLNVDAVSVWRWRKLRWILLHNEEYAPYREFFYDETLTKKLAPGSRVFGPGKSG